MPEIKYHIVKTRSMLPEPIRQLLIKNLVASVIIDNSDTTGWCNVIIGRFGTNKTTLRKILKEKLSPVKDK